MRRDADKPAFAQLLLLDLLEQRRIPRSRGTDVDARDDEIDLATVLGEVDDPTHDARGGVEVLGATVHRDLCATRNRHPLERDFELVREVERSDDAVALAQARTPLKLPVTIPEWVSPILSIIPGQLFAMHLAHARDFDVDNPRAIRKVTETR